MPSDTSRSASAPKNGEPNGVVRLLDVHKSFGHNHVLRGLTLSFPAGCTTVVLGPSGCGKSVMLKHTIGLLKPDAGEVWYGDVRIDTRPEHALSGIRRDFGYLFQNGALFDSLSVRDNVAFPLVEHTRFSAEQRRERVRYVVSLVGLIDFLDQMPSELSGGQRKRVALARAIVLDPKVILYDEPTTGLDPIRADTINELILKLKRELQVTSIVVTHDLASAFKVADRMVMLHEGVVVLEGEPEAFRRSTDPIVKRFLMGEATPEYLDAMLAAAKMDEPHSSGRQGS